MKMMVGMKIKKKYNPDDLLKNKDDNIEILEQTKQNVQIIEYKYLFYTNYINCIKIIH